MISIKKTLKALASHAVVDSGTTSAGYTWYKYADGLAEVYGTGLISASLGTASSKIILPFDMINVNFTVITSLNQNGSVVTIFGEYDINGNKNRTTNSFNICASKTGGNYPIGFDFHVIGRWK